MGVAGDCTEEIRKITAVNTKKFSGPSAPGLRKSDRTSWIENRDWDSNGYDSAYNEVARSNFGDVDADFSGIKAQVSSTKISVRDEVISVKEPMEKLRQYVEAKQALSGLDGTPTEFLTAFNIHKENYKNCRSNIKDTDEQIRRLLKSKENQKQIDPASIRLEITRLEYEITQLANRKDPLEEDLRIANEKLSAAVQLKETLDQEATK